MESKYIVFDGMDGSGKGTQLALLQEKFGDRIVFTREPGGPPFAETIREILRDHPDAKNSTPFFHFLCFWAAREETMHRLVMPALEAGNHVFSDRGDSSTLAFQIFGERKTEWLGLFNSIRNKVFHAKGRRRPNRYIVFDLPAEVARERVMSADRGSLNHFDARELPYYERVREGFKAFSLGQPVTFIDASRPVEEVHTSVLGALASEGIRA